MKKKNNRRFLIVLAGFWSFIIFYCVDYLLKLGWLSFSGWIEGFFTALKNVIFGGTS
jgi:hypothetical protein